MARPLWTGSISFGMVSIPIRLVPAVKRKSIAFNQIDDQTMSRMRLRKVSEATGEEVPSEHIVKGHDIGGRNYVLITDDDLAPLSPAKSKEINLETFVPVQDVNPLMFDSSYLIIIEQKAAGKTPVFAKMPAVQPTVIDLAAALEASLRDAKKARANHPSVTSVHRSSAKKAVAAKRSAPKQSGAEPAEKSAVKTRPRKSA